MKPVEFLLLHDNPNAGALLASILGSDVSIEVSSWADSWDRVMQTALHKKGPDLAVIGSTWTPDLVGMNALRTFTQNEISMLGTPRAFLPSIWRTAYHSDPNTISSIPWLCGSYVIYYWRDMLEKAGIDEKTAFSTPVQLKDTLQRLQAHGNPSPWSAPTKYKYAHLNSLVSWIWGMEGDLLSTDGKRLLFDQPQALTAIREYFHLYQYLHPSLRLGTDQYGPNLFLKREVAATIGVTAWLSEIKNKVGIDPAQGNNLGVALPPGPAYVGGNSLAIFNYTQQPENAFKVIQALLDPDMQKQLNENPMFGYLPVLSNLFDQHPFDNDPHYQVLAQAVKTGRSYPNERLWGMIEKRLGQSLFNIEAQLLNNPDTNLETLVYPEIQALANRLRMTLDLQ